MGTTHLSAHCDAAVVLLFVDLKRATMIVHGLRQFVQGAAAHHDAAFVAGACSHQLHAVLRQEQATGKKSRNLKFLRLLHELRMMPTKNAWSAMYC